MFEEITNVRSLNLMSIGKEHDETRK